MSGNHALIFGASGITGWAIVDSILKGYPTEESFDSVTALTNRPLSAEAALWPASKKLQVVSGLDLLTTKGQEGLEEDMKAKIKGIETVTHVYFFAYVMDPDGMKEVEINKTLLSRAVNAVDNLSKNLKFILLPTGTKAYGVHLLSAFPFPDSLPLSESLPRIPEPHASEMFYYASIDMMTSLSATKSWTWCEIIPDNIIGFVPNNNVYCLAQTLGIYLSLYAALNGKGAKCAFPGTEASWKILSNEGNQTTVAKFSIFASLHPEKTGGQRFNVGDNPTPSSWSVKWPAICEYFGLVGAPPPAGGSGPQPGTYMLEHMDEWHELEKKHGLKTGHVGTTPAAYGFQYFIMLLFDFDRPLDLTREKEVWGSDIVEIDAKASWWPTMDLFRKAKIIP